MIHIIPRKENDGLKFELPQKENKLKELEEIRKKLVENLGSKVEDKEAEEPFFDKGHKRFKDRLHSGEEERFRIIGKTKKERLLFIAFTMRGKKIRIISARGINKKEVKLYEENA